MKIISVQHDVGVLDPLQGPKMAKKQHFLDLKITIFLANWGPIEFLPISTVTTKVHAKFQANRTFFVVSRALFLWQIYTENSQKCQKSLANWAVDAIFLNEMKFLLNSTNTTHVHAIYQYNFFKKVQYELSTKKSFSSYYTPPSHSQPLCLVQISINDVII